MDLTSLDLIQENKYCSIFRSESGGQPFIIKKYKGEDPSLIKKEARALDFYHDIAKEAPDLIDSRAVKLNVRKNILCIGFVQGECFSDVLYGGRKDEAVRQRSIRIMGILGKLLKSLYNRTHQPGAETSPFIFEYAEYCSRQLEGIPVLGFLFFRGLKTATAALSENFRAAGITPSFIHGDFVFRNIHVDGERVGLIDLANTIQRSHTLNDFYNLHFALRNMLLPRDFKEALWSALQEGLRPISFPEIAHHFYYEYHRRRWLMLKMKNGSIKDRIEAFRGLLLFAKPFEKVGGMP